MKIWPRSAGDKGGIVCMPMKKNIPEGRNDWKLCICKGCGRECWETPLARYAKEQQGADALCTECALRKGLEENKNDKLLRM